MASISDNDWIVDEVVNRPSQFTVEECFRMIAALAEWKVEFPVRTEEDEGN